MKTRSIVLITGLLVAVVAALAAPEGALALTNACTNISNTATIDYEVASVAQTAKTGSTNFYVGSKVNLTVIGQDGSKTVSVSPKQSGATLTFRISNLGNATQKYVYTATHRNPATVNAIADDFSATLTSAGSGTTANVNPGATVDITVVANIPDQVDGDGSVWALQAITYNVDDTLVTQGTSSIPAQNGNGACSAEVVFGDDNPTVSSTDDGARDGKASDREVYKVIAANLTISKSSAAVYDPVNCSNTSYAPNFNPASCTGGTPKAIPGGYVEYTITIHNSASGTAQSVKVTDALDVAHGLTFDSDGYSAGHGISVVDGGGGSYSLLTAGGNPGPVTGDFTAGTLTVNGMSVATGQTATVKYRALIQ